MMRRTKATSPCCFRRNLVAILLFIVVGITVTIILEAPTGVEQSQITSPLLYQNISVSKLPKIQDHRNTQECVPDVNKKVSVQFCGGLGNQLFQYASLYGISKTNCRTPLGSLYGSEALRETFSNLRVSFRYLKGITNKHIENRFFQFDESFMRLPDYPHICLRRFLQSLKYFEKYKTDLRLQLKIKRELIESADKFILTVKSNLIAANMTLSENLTFVGVHQRKVGKQPVAAINLKVIPMAGKPYFQKAMDYFRQKYINVHFLVASADLEWVRTNLNSTDVTITGQSDILDFVILTRCSHVIMSVGTYGWWAGWLAGGEVTYKDPQFTPGGFLEKDFKKEHYFPPHWVAFQE